MDDLYQAKLSATPYPPPHPHPQVHVGDNQTPPNQDYNHSHDDATHTRPLHQQQQQQPIPIQFPNIYVHPYPTIERERERTPPPAPQPRTEQPPVTVNVTALSNEDQIPKGNGSKIGPFRITKPHPLLWVSLILSFIALVLEVPKGSLPTLTGRHKALRTQERLVSEKIALLTKLSTFLPPPLSNLVAPTDPNNPFSASHLTLNDDRQLDLLRLAPHLRFWNTAIGAPYGTGVGEDGRGWWSIEDIGQGASVVRSKDGEREKEVWVLEVGEGDDNTNTVALSSALAHSLLLRDRLQAEIERLKAIPCPSCPNPSPFHLDSMQAHKEHDDNDEAYQIARKEEWERLEERKRREKERQKEVEEREREVARREKWVVEEMRKMSEKIHGQATELTLEDRITERLKSYQRQLNHLKENDKVEL
ncbi:uncharacterized protein IL334_003231 [Kwoniella shivajii]|uniref:Uncharacterized protein n=1 Tax=Kwoniella shivajii TaxID=564305 RepID=A0ABZ1CWZ6_9TREE|nr:hypothetical protein IL334_003231 [Kwoniella shivajii]